MHVKHDYYNDNYYPHYGDNYYQHYGDNKYTTDVCRKKSVLVATDSGEQLF